MIWTLSTPSRYHQHYCLVGSLTGAMGNSRRAQGDTRRRAHGCTHRTHGVDFETRDAVSMRRRGQPNDAGVAWVVATPGPKRFSTSKQSPIRQQHQQLKRQQYQRTTGVAMSIQERS